MSAEQAYAFLVFAFVAAVTPGPGNVMLTAVGANAGIVRGLPCLLGIDAGMALQLLLVAFGLGSVILGHPDVVEAMKWIGAAFLLWLAWKIATAKGSGGEAASRPVGFFEAAALQWINPKAWLVTTSAAGTYLRADGGVLAQALSLAGLFLLAALPSGFVWLAFGTALRRFLGSPRRLRAFNLAMGALLAGSVVLFVL
ncbi:MAG TPA: LysE family translocator [Burkholderiales bacterium]|jgi:threonine/homoserine/homoserine lactone efflux protein